MGVGVYCALPFFSPVVSEWPPVAALFVAKAELILFAVFFLLA